MPVKEDPPAKELALFVRSELSRLELAQPTLLWHTDADVGATTQLPIVCSLPGKEDSLNLFQEPASRLPRRLVVKNQSTNSVGNEEEFLLAGVSSILNFWQELFRFGEHVCCRGNPHRDDAWPTGVKIEAGRLRSGRISSVWLPWSAVVEFLHHDHRDAPSALILSIAESASHDLEVLVRKPRMFLRRVRRKVPLGRAQQLDAACLSWLIKRPGRTAIEKAGSAQEILAVVREESFDTLENQVLKDFIQRASRACWDYLRENSAFGNSARYKCVKEFDRALSRYAQANVFTGVRSLSRITNPNYVLQHDEHYSTIWKSHQDLVRRQASIEHLFEWRFRAYRDLVRLLFCCTAWSLSAETERQTRSDSGQGLWIRQKPDAGSIFEANGWPTPLRCDRSDGFCLFIVAPEQLRRNSYMGVPIREVIASLGPDLAVIVTRPDTREFSLWVVWTSFGSRVPPSCTPTGLTGERTSTLLRKIATKYSAIRGLHGILVTGTPRQSEPDAPEGVGLLSVSNDYLSWRQDELSRTEEMFRKLIQQDKW